MEILIVLIKCAVVLGLVMGLASTCTWFERKVSALIQDRVGANRAGAFVTFDPIALKPLQWVLRILGRLGFTNTLLCDSVKAILKEDFIAKGVSPFIHSLAPFLAVTPIFLAFAVIPLAPNFTLFGYEITTQIAPIDAGLLFVFAMGSVAVYGVAIAGWTGNNKYSLLGGLRASAQMISYELAMSLAFVSMVAIYGTLDLYKIVTMQDAGHWGIVMQPFSFIILFIVGMAETKRAPFDLPEAESELTAGYFTEYSGMKFLLFWLGEFAEIALFSVVLTVLFLGGWSIPGVQLPADGAWYWALLGHVVLMTKVVALCIFQIIIRWSLPRFRYDQLMNLGWRILLPLSLVNVLGTGVVRLLLRGV
jgi:NADH-quinone oxidoreductase subunit H